MPTTLGRAMVVFAPEKTSQVALSQVPDLHVLVQLNANKVNKVKHLFIVVTASQLPMVSEIVKAANETKYLRGLFIRADVDAKLLPQILQRADLRLMRNILVHDMDDWKTPKRVMNAWQMGSENDLIAAAAVFEDRLCVLTCAFERLEVPFDVIPAFKKVNPKQRSNFVLDDAGSFLHWPDSDVHLDIDVFRYAIDDKWRAKCDLERLVHNKKFGHAIASIRRKHDLRQSDISKLTDRQVRRIESGEARPSVATLTLLASAHKLTLDKYLNQVGSLMKE